MRQFIDAITLSEAVLAYHGSTMDNPTFDSHHTGHNSHTFGAYESTRHGIFFTDDPEFAALYGKVGRYRLNIHHTLDLENDNNAIWDFVQSIDPFGPDRNLWIEARGIMYDSKYWPLFEDEVGERFVAFLRERGYDSASFHEYNEDDNGQEHESHTIVVFDPQLVQRA